MSDVIQINQNEIPVEQIKNDWALALMSRGIIVKISMHRWRGIITLKPETLGMKFLNTEVEDFVKKYITLGTQRLFPKEVFHELNFVENESKKNLNDHSFDTVWGSFVPYMAFDDWKIKNDEIRQAYYKCAVVLGNNYNNILCAVKNDYKKLAKDVWARLYPQNPNSYTDSFIEGFSDNVIKQIPSREYIINSFSYTETFFTIPLPALIESNLAKADQIKRDNELKELEVSLEKETKKRIAEEYLSKKKELVDGFLDSTVGFLRSHVSELCNSILASLKRRENCNVDVTSSQRGKILKMIEKVKYLNFYEDEEINKYLSELGTEVVKFKGERNTAFITDKLKEIIDLSKKEFVPKVNPSISYLKIIDEPK